MKMVGLIQNGTKKVARVLFSPRKPAFTACFLRTTMAHCLPAERAKGR